MALKIGNFAVIHTEAERQITGNARIIRTPIQPTVPLPIIRRTTPGTTTIKTDDIKVKTTTKGVNPLAYAGSLLFGVPGAIASGVMALQKDQPTTTIIGKPKDVAAYTGVIPGAAPGGAAADPFGGALGSIGTGLKYAGILIPAALGIMLLTQVKGLFKFGR